jgi:hypothetical protein
MPHIRGGGPATARAALPTHRIRCYFLAAADVFMSSIVRNSSSSCRS